MLGVVGRRTCAGLAASSAVLHGVSVGHTTSAAAAVVLVAMASVCLYCARDLWMSGTSRAWVLVATIATIAMFIVATGGHRHGGEVAAGAGSGLSTAMTAAMVIAAVEVIAAVAVLCQRSRGTAGRLASS
jgi:hypothetical protein